MKAEIKKGNKRAYIKKNSVDQCFYVDIVMDSDISEYGDVLHSNKVFKSEEKALEFANKQLA